MRTRKNPSDNPLGPGDHEFMVRAMREMGISRLQIFWDDSKKVHPDIWVILGDPPVIYVTAEWRRQDAAERRKRLVHEMRHILGDEHGAKPGGLMYSTYPDKDTYSADLYRKLQSTRNNPSSKYIATIYTKGGYYHIPSDNLNQLIKICKDDIKNGKSEYEVTQVYIHPMNKNSMPDADAEPFWIWNSFSVANPIAAMKSYAIQNPGTEYRRIKTDMGTCHRLTVKNAQNPILASLGGALISGLGIGTGFQIVNSIKDKYTTKRRKK